MEQKENQRIRLIKALLTDAFLKAWTGASAF